MKFLRTRQFFEMTAFSKLPIECFIEQMFEGWVFTSELKTPYRLIYSTIHNLFFYRGRLRSNATRLLFTTAAFNE